MSNIETSAWRVPTLQSSVFCELKRWSQRDRIKILCRRVLLAFAAFCALLAARFLLGSGPPLLKYFHRMRVTPLRLLLLLLALVLGAISGAYAAEEAAPRGPWDMQTLSRVPQTYAAPDFPTSDVRPLFFAGLPWKGAPTRVFAWLGIPEHTPGQKLPGIVLVHGGGATAFANWVRLWNRRGYAAIAMDTCGSVPNGNDYSMTPPRHEMGGPPGWGGFTQIEEPVTDQWTYHAVADVILAHSLLRAQPAVDAQNIGITGVSWGGYLTCIAAGIDDRWKFAAPVYGSGFLLEDSVWLPNFKRMGEANARRWNELWDPSQYLGRAKMPFLWVTGTNDFAYPLGSLQKSYRLLRPELRRLCIRIRMNHAHGGPGENPEEIHVFANAHTRGTPNLATIAMPVQNGDKVLCRFQAARPVVRAELCFTKDTGPWLKRLWESVPMQLDTTKREVTATLPPGTRTYYINLIDGDDLVVSSEHVEIEAATVGNVLGADQP
ncbi:MAG: hypothetical protein JWN98_2257 [Abditibacteriota bacterium]|nr:hypothetical protein [Abditibacteriota bacterium]